MCLDLLDRGVTIFNGTLLVHGAQLSSGVARILRRGVRMYTLFLIQGAILRTGLSSSESRYINMYTVFHKSPYI